MNKRNIVLSGLLIVIIISVFYALKPDSGGNTTEPIKIGSILILSGEGASWGEAARNGMDLALADLNAKGGVLGRKVVAIHEDGNSPQTSLSAFNKLAFSDKTKFIIGPSWSTSGVALQEPATKNKIVMISPSLGVKEFNEHSPYLFNTWPHDYLISIKLAEYVFAQGHHHIALLGAKDVFVSDQTNAFKDRFEALGGTVELLYEPTVETTDTRTEIGKIKQNKAITAVVMTTDGYNLTVHHGQTIATIGYPFTAI